jgi:membrane-associated protease RseP (regulator of RpoE activity)
MKETRAGTIAHTSIPCRDKLVSLLQRQLLRCLDLVALESNGEILKPDAFSSESPSVLLKSQVASYSSPRRIQYEGIFSYSRSEPRLEFIRRNLGRALLLGMFSASEKPLHADGFRLFNLRKWANYSVSTPQGNFSSISSYCNCNCEFCYERGTRKTPVFHLLGRKNLSLQETDTRLRYYSPEAKTGLIPASNFALEPFVNSHCLEILEKFHAADPEAALELTTNGSYLTEDVIARLAKLKPIMLMISINAATEEMRQRVMHGRPMESAKIALDSFALLRKYEIPVQGSYVPWPSKPLSDLEDAIRLMDEQDVMQARVCMPSFTRFHGEEPPFDTNQYWQDILLTIQRLREEVRIPIRILPGSYEFQTSVPIVQGCIKNSPAARAGIRFGDRIVAIDGQEIYTLTQMHGLFKERAQNSDIRATVFSIERDGVQFDVEIAYPEDVSKEPYPYRVITDGVVKSPWLGSLGINYSDGFPLTNIARLFDACNEHRGERILLFTSELMEPRFREALAMVEDMVELLDHIELYVEKPIHRFWGGNIVIGDIWTIPDLIAHTQEWMEATGIRPDIVVVASSFLSPGKYDLLGNCYLEFERQLDIELQLIPCSAIMG